MSTRFEWDLAEAAIDLRKHAISFDIALRVSPIRSRSLNRFALKVMNSVGKRWGSLRGICSSW